MSPDERGCSVFSTDSISLKMRESNMGSIVTESTHAPEHHESVHLLALEPLLDAEESVIDTTEPRDLITSSIPPPTENYEEREVIYALQTSYNSLHFLPKREEGIRRSNSFSLPSSNSKQDEVSNDQVMWKFNFGCRGGKLPQVRKMPLQKHKDLEQEERVFHFGKNRREVLTETVPEELRTSVMLRSIPRDYSRDDILHLLHVHGFGDDINFLSLPIDVRTRKNVGYVFINFRFPEDALEFKSVFTGHLFFPESSGPEEGACVEWRYPIQGFASHFDLFMRSYITHSPQLPPQFKPVLVRDGKAIPFPEAWAEIKICHGKKRFIGVERKERKLWAKNYKLKKYKKVRN